MLGKLITFEGGEGCGKTTQAKLLSDYLISRGHKVFSTREPGGDEIGEKLRSIVKDPKYNGKISNNTELLLYLTARSSFVNNTIKPKIDEGYVVISDRYIDSTTAYQGYGNKMDMGAILLLNNMVSQGINPNLTFLIDIKAEKGLESISTKEFGRADRIESKGLGYHEMVNEGYRKIAKDNPERIKIIKYIEGSIKEMHNEIIIHAKELLLKQ